MHDTRGYRSVVLMMVLVAPSFAWAQSASLIEAAKKEGGRVVVYGSLQDNSMEPIGRAFQAKTGLEFNYCAARRPK